MLDLKMQSVSSHGLYRRAIQQMARRKWVVACCVIIVMYLGIALFGALNLLPDPELAVGARYDPPAWTLSTCLGTDYLGRSVFFKILAGTKTAILIGFLVTAIAVPMGMILGTIAGFYGGLVDVGVVWLYTVVSSVPYILIVIAISYVMGKGLVAICVAMGSLGWVQLCRLIRGEVLKYRESEYVLASRALGASDLRIMLTHLLPNTLHLAIISSSLQVLTAIKSEVILTYLGFGIQDGSSWGTMIADAKGELVQGIWWPLMGVVLAMFLIIYALNVVGDALRDVLDPKFY